MPDALLNEIHLLGWRGRTFNPHKPIALLSAIKILELQGFSTKKIFFNELFKKIFFELFVKLLPNTTSSCRPHTPFFHLRTSSFWTLVPKSGKESELASINTIGGPGALMELVDYALISDDLFNLIKNDAKRKELVSVLHNCIINEKNNVKKLLCDLETENNCCKWNQFVNYLNSLQRFGGSNENALAESQACNRNFVAIHVPHPLAEVIYEELNRPNGCHVILTGHAGDGKSTIALEIYKRLSDIPSDAPLQRPLKPREDVGAISIIKDLSERDKKEDQTLLDELTDGKRRFLLVSNTGTLLDLIKGQPEYFHASETSLESKVLNAISTENGEASLSLNIMKFRVFNLSRMDNLTLARKIFTKMLAPERWQECGTCEYQNGCPIFLNVSLLRANNGRAIERIFLAYRRMYEYGTRLTIRQFTEHLSYMITAGLNKDDIAQFSILNNRLTLTRHLFFNRFFGDDGGKKDPVAQEFSAVQAIKKHGFGERPAPSWEHRLWLHNSGPEFKLGVRKIDDVFDELRRVGSRNQDESAREQIRRMLFFLYDFKPEEQKYLSQYLNSPTLLEWYGWQENEEYLSFAEKDNLEEKIYHVLLEHFTGIRLPEGLFRNDRRLYVTLSRQRSEVRQSAQIVLAQIDWSTATILELREFKNASGVRRKDLVLRGKGCIDGIELLLPVPFLDYVMMRHFGELGEVLDPSYRQRLDRFKAQVLKQAAVVDDKRIMLVRLRTDHTFRRQYFSLNNGHLEVHDVL
jgi:hypothetical protein